MAQIPNPTSVNPTNASTLQNEALQLALLIRRSDLRLKHVPEAVRPQVAVVLRSMTSAQAGLIAGRPERKRYMGRTGSVVRNAMSC